MKICLVTAFPPSREALNEYGFHVASELKNAPGISLTILGDDDFPAGEPEMEGFEVVRCWAFNRLNNGRRLLEAITRIQPDLVWFNLGFASFGGKPVPAFAGICIPARTRMAGFYTHVTLHQLMETVDLKDAGVRFPWLYRTGGFLATQVLLLANSVSVMMPAYRDILRRKYRRGSVYVRRHGILAARPEYPDFSLRGNPRHRILAFGKWGTYKRLELLIEGFATVGREFPNAELIVAGTDHPKTPGYLKQMAEQCAGQPQIKFIGYVAEQDVPQLFQTSTLTAMPYTSSAGSSGIAHLACAYGVPIVASDLPDFRQLAEEEGLAIDYFDPGSAAALAERILAILESPERQMEMALQNVSAALRMSMPEIVRQYLENFELRQELDRLGSLARVRKLPRWIPLRARLLGRPRRKLFGTPMPQDATDLQSFSSVDSDSDRSGHALAAGVSVNRERIGADGGGERSTLNSAAQSAAASAEHSRSAHDHNE